MATSNKPDIDFSYESDGSSTVVLKSSDDDYYNDYSTNNNNTTVTTTNTISTTPPSIHTNITSNHRNHSVPSFIIPNAGNSMSDAANYLKGGEPCFIRGEHTDFDHSLKLWRNLDGTWNLREILFACGRKFPQGKQLTSFIKQRQRTKLKSQDALMMDSDEPCSEIHVSTRDGVHFAMSPIDFFSPDSFLPKEELHWNIANDDRARLHLLHRKIKVPQTFDHTFVDLLSLWSKRNYGTTSSHQFLAIIPGYGGGGGGTSLVASLSSSSNHPQPPLTILPIQKNNSSNHKRTKLLSSEDNNTTMGGNMMISLSSSSSTTSSSLSVTTSTPPLASCSTTHDDVDGIVLDNDVILPARTDEPYVHHIKQVMEQNGIPQYVTRDDGEPFHYHRFPRGVFVLLRLFCDSTSAVSVSIIHRDDADQIQSEAIAGMGSSTHYNNHTTSNSKKTNSSNNTSVVAMKNHGKKWTVCALAPFTRIYHCELRTMEDILLIPPGSHVAISSLTSQKSCLYIRWISCPQICGLSFMSALQNPVDNTLEHRCILWNTAHTIMDAIRTIMISTTTTSSSSTGNSSSSSSTKTGLSYRERNALTWLKKAGWDILAMISYLVKNQRFDDNWPFPQLENDLRGVLLDGE
jgi:hypothetical protein